MTVFFLPFALRFFVENIDVLQYNLYMILWNLLGYS